MEKYYVEKRVYLSEELCNAIDDLKSSANWAFDLESNRNDGFTCNLNLPLRDMSKKEYERLIEILNKIERKTDKYQTYALFVDDYDIVSEGCEKVEYICVAYIVVRVLDDMDKKEIKYFKHHVNHNIINRLVRFMNSLNCFSNDD